MEFAMNHSLLCDLRTSTPLRAGSATQSANRQSAIRNPRPFAFTLVELLVVISIIAIMMALVVPAVTSLLASSNLSQGGRIVADQISLARQIASTRNCTTEVRLIELSGTGQGYNGLQIWVSGTGNSTIPAGKIVPLPQAIAISENKTNLSKMLSYLTSGTMPSGVAAGASYVSFSLRPSGEVVPVLGGASDRSSLYLTVVPARLAASATLPPNFVTIQLNPDNGSPLLFRP